MKAKTIILKICEILILTFILAVGGYLRLHDIKATGIEDLQGDEARIGIGAASIIHYATPILNYASPHEPPLSLYYPIPFMAVFGRGLWALKLAPIFFGLAAVALTYFAARELFSARAGATAALFLAVLPFHATFSRILYEHSFLPAFSAGIFFCYARHLKNGSPRLLYAAAALAGLGLSTKIIFLYFIVSFIAAAAVAGRAMRPRAGARQAVVAFSFFLLGALPFIALVSLSGDFFRILEETRGGGVFDSLDTLYAAFASRLLMVNTVFTPAASFAAAAWVVFFILRKKLDPWPVLLIVFCLVLLCLSTITVSGTAIHHMLVFLPAPLVLAAGLVDLPAARFPRGADLLAALAVVMLSFLWRPAVNATSAHVGAGVNSMTHALESMPPEKTIPVSRDIAMVQAFLVFRGKGILPPVRNRKIVSFFCNRYKSCSSDGQAEVFRDIDFIFRTNILKKEKKQAPWNAYTDPHFFDGKNTGILRETILDLVNDGCKYFIINSRPEPGHPYFFLNRQVEQAFVSLFREGRFHMNQTEFKGDFTAYKIIEVVDFDKGNEQKKTPDKMPK